MVDEGRGEPGVQAHALSAPVALAAIGPALIADFLEIGVHQTEAVSGVHVRRTASRVPNEN